MEAKYILVTACLMAILLPNSRANPLREDEESTPLGQDEESNYEEVVREKRSPRRRGRQEAEGDAEGEEEAAELPIWCKPNGFRGWSQKAEGSVDAKCRQLAEELGIYPPAEE